MISFESFPATARASTVAVELKGKRRTLAGNTIPEIVLIPGQYDPANTGVVENEPKQLFTADAFGDYYGYGSEIHRQAMWIFALLGGFSENVWGMALAIPTGTPAAADGDVVFATAASSAGTFYVSVGGDLIAVSLPNGATPTEAGAAFEAAVNANKRLAVTASNTTGTVTLTAKWVGATGNQINVVANPGGDVQSGENPGGMTITAPGLLTGGSGDALVSGAFFDDGEDALRERWYTIITCPYQDSTNLTAYKTLADLRSAPEVNRRFAAYVGYVGKTYAEAFAIPATINHPSICPAWESRALVPDFELGAALAGLVAASATFDPGRPFKTLPVGVPTTVGVDNLAYAKNDALFRAGIGYFAIDGAGVLRAGDIPTSYRTNPGGASTEEWFDAVSIHRRQQFAYDIETMGRSDPYTRGMLASDDVVTGKDYVVKPKTLGTDLINLVDVWASEGWVKNPEEIKETILTLINAGNNSRLDGALTLDEAQALRIVAIKATFLY